MASPSQMTKKKAPTTDIDAILRDNTIEPSVKNKDEGNGKDMFFRNFGHQSDPI